MQLTHGEVTCAQTQAKFLETVLSQIGVPVHLVCCDTMQTNVCNEYHLIVLAEMTTCY